MRHYGKNLYFSPSKTKKIKKNHGSGVMNAAKEVALSTASRQLIISQSQSVEKIPQALPLPPFIVEFTIDGSSERLGVHESLSVVDQGTRTNFTPLVHSNISIASSKSVVKGKCRRSKSVSRLSDKNKRLTMQISATDDDITGDNSHQKGLEANLFEAKFRVIEDFQSIEAPERSTSYIRHMEQSPTEMVEDISVVDYDLDEIDCAWLEIFNKKRKSLKLTAVDPDVMEFLIDRFEKEAFQQMQSIGAYHSPPIDDDAECCVCLDGECQNSNVILFCDICNMAIHQECYGVPYIPEGQWLCRLCLQNPDAKGAGVCELCPNKGGAFKQTIDGKWAHVICAIWIPEVCFSNTVFLEPIDGINNIPPARWKLTCFICKQKGIGACIQCHKSNCYKAFHVTCAQQANIVMTIATVRYNSAIVVKKTAWCDLHTPHGTDRMYKEGVDPSTSRHKLKETRKLLAERRDAMPSQFQSVPSISKDRLQAISCKIKLTGKRSFIERLLAYWKLRRQSRNGVPLLRRLQMSSLRSNIQARDKEGSENRTAASITGDQSNAVSTAFKDWLKLRQDLEKVRLLSELVRKREQLKLSAIRTKERISDLTLRPFNMFLAGMVEEMIRRDINQIFTEAVDTKKVSNYLDFIQSPMDLGTMLKKAESFGYSSINDLHKDFHLMINNCITFNEKETIFYKSALKMREAGEAIINEARKRIKAIGFDAKTGLHSS